MRSYKIQSRKQGKQSWVWMLRCGLIEEPVSIFQAVGSAQAEAQQTCTWVGLDLSGWSEEVCTHAGQMTRLENYEGSLAWQMRTWILSQRQQSNRMFWKSKAVFRMRDEQIKKHFYLPCRAGPNRNLPDFISKISPGVQN